MKPNNTKSIMKKVLPLCVFAIETGLVLAESTIKKTLVTVDVTALRVIVSDPGQRSIEEICGDQAGAKLRNFEQLTVDTENDVRIRLRSVPVCVPDICQECLRKEFNPLAHILHTELCLLSTFFGDVAVNCNVKLLPFMSSSISETVESNKQNLDCQQQCIRSISEIENDFEYAAWWYNLIGVKRVMVQNCRTDLSVKASCYIHSTAPTLSLGQTEELAM